MTLLTPETTGGPRTHAIVIAAGYYPYLKDGRHPHFPGMKDLESPPYSAAEFVEWFLEEYENPSAPRGTLDLYVSASSAPYQLQRPNGTVVDIDPATKANVTVGIERWADHVDQHLDDIAIFFFCGHGVSAGSHNGLLLEDFYANPKAKLKNALDIDGLKDAMDICKARRQIYFSDACRNTPSGIDEAVQEGGIGDSVITGNRKKGRHGAIDAPIFYSALGGQKAYGRRGKSSVFTAALLESLRRGAAVKEGGGWQIRTRRMLDSLNVNLRRICRQEKLPFAGASLSDGSDFELHHLSLLPKIPVVVRCEPVDAIAEADLAYTTRTGDITPRPTRGPDVWDVDVDADWYEFRADFAAGKYNSCASGEVIQPPGADVQLNVGGA
jgi:hypothetical protein